MPPTGEGLQWQKKNQHKLSIFLFLKTFKLASIMCVAITLCVLCVMQNVIISRQRCYIISPDNVSRLVLKIFFL